MDIFFNFYRDPYQRRILLILHQILQIHLPLQGHLLLQTLLVEDFHKNKFSHQHTQGNIRKIEIKMIFINRKLKILINNCKIRNINMCFMEIKFVFSSINKCLLIMLIKYIEIVYVN